MYLTLWWYFEVVCNHIDIWTLLTHDRRVFWLSSDIVRVCHGATNLFICRCIWWRVFIMISWNCWNIYQHILLFVEPSIWLLNSDLWFYCLRISCNRMLRIFLVLCKDIHTSWNDSFFASNLVFCSYVLFVHFGWSVDSCYIEETRWFGGTLSTKFKLL